MAYLPHVCCFCITEDAVQVPRLELAFVLISLLFRVSVNYSDILWICLIPSATAWEHANKTYAHLLL